MGAKGEALAKKFEAKAQEATAVFEKVSDADWKKVTSAEKWPVGVAAHHVAMSHQGISGIVKGVAEGTFKQSVNMDTIHQMNAQHAKDFANVGKTETIALHKKNAAAAAAVLRSISDEQFAKSAAVLGGAPPMSAEQLAGGLLCSHVDEHLGSIRSTCGM